MCALILLKRVFVSASVGLHLAERWGGGGGWEETLKAVRISSHRYTVSERGEQSPPSWEEQITVRIQNHDEVIGVGGKREVKNVCMLKWVQHDFPLCF